MCSYVLYSYWTSQNCQLRDTIDTSRGAVPLRHVLGCAYAFGQGRPGQSVSDTSHEKATINEKQTGALWSQDDLRHFFPHFFFFFQLLDHLAFETYPLPPPSPSQHTDHIEEGGSLKPCDSKLKTCCFFAVNRPVITALRFVLHPDLCWLMWDIKKTDCSGHPYVGCSFRMGRSRVLWGYCCTPMWWLLCTLCDGVYTFRAVTWRIWWHIKSVKAVDGLRLATQRRTTGVVKVLPTELYG